MKKIQTLILLFCITFLSGATISGFINDESNGEPIASTSILIGGTEHGTLTNEEGYFVLNNVMTGKIDLYISNIAYKPQKVEQMIEDPKAEIFLKINMKKAKIKIEDYDVNATDLDHFIESREIEVGSIVQRTEDILQIPNVADADVFRALQFTPGVTAISDFSSGLYVRGGSPDQNLILLDNTDVYNPNHFGGIFSTFNTDAIENVELLKGGFPARYGGRLSSVLNVTNLDGNRKRHQGVARLSLISSNATLQGPWRIGTQSGSYMASFRRTYLDIIAKMANIDIPDYYFYDGHTKMNWDITQKDKIMSSFYFGKDKLSVDFGSKMILSWGNETLTSQWQHIFSPQIYSKFIFCGSHFGSLMKIESDADETVERTNDIYDATLKSMLNYHPDEKHIIDVGLENKLNNVTFKFSMENSNADPSTLPDIEVNSIQNAFYLQDSWKINYFWTLQPGIRLNYVHNWSPNLPAAPDADYFRISPRFSLRYKIKALNSIYFNYGRYYQYLTSLSPGISTPLDLWFPLDGTVEPGISDHFIFGYKTQIQQKFALDIEAYYKNYENLVEYNPEVDYEWDNETGTLSDAFNMGKGYSYGTDILLRTELFNLEGFLGYSFGITKRKIENNNINPETEEEKYFYPRYDRTHQMNVVESYDLTNFFSRFFSGPDVKFAFTYSFATGQPYQQPELLYFDEDKLEILYSYSDRIRLPEYSRLDLSLKIKWKYTNWSLEPYLQIINLLDHENVWSYNFDYKIDEVGNIRFEKESGNMFPRIPFIGINIYW